MGLCASHVEASTWGRDCDLQKLIKKKFTFIGTGISQVGNDILNVMMTLIESSMIMKIEGSGQRRLLEKIWWDCVKEDVKSFGLSRVGKNHVFFEKSVFLI